MSVPVLDDPEYGVRFSGRVRLRALPNYEPDYEPGEPARRWSSLRPASGPQLSLRLAPASPRRTAPPVSPATLWRLLGRVLEVLDGRRQVGQLRTLLPDTAYEALLTRLRTARPGRRHTLKRLHACYPSPRVVELSAVIEVTAAAPARSRVIAAAARFELDQDTWRCKVLRLL